MTWLARGGLIGLLSSITLPTCEKCLAGKSVNKSFEKAKHASTLLDLIHSDICGPFNLKARNGCFYHITDIDDFSRSVYVYLISHKSEALRCFSVTWQR